MICVMSCTRTAPHLHAIAFFPPIKRFLLTRFLHLPLQTPGFLFAEHDMQKTRRGRPHFTRQRAMRSLQRIMRQLHEHHIVQEPSGWTAEQQAHPPHTASNKKPCCTPLFTTRRFTSSGPVCNSLRARPLSTQALTVSLMLAILAMLAVLLSLLYMYGYSYKARDMLKHRDVEAPESDPRQTRRTWPLVFAISCSGVPSSHAIQSGV